MWYNLDTSNKESDQSDVGSILWSEQVLKGELTVSHSTPDVPHAKTCTQCGQTKPATTEYYSRHKRYKGGLRSQCKKCAAGQNRTWREANPQYMHAWREANPGYNNAYCEAHRKQAAERTRVWRKANPARVAEQNRAYREAHKEQSAEYYRTHCTQRKFYKKHKAEYDRIYRKVNPERYAAYARNRRSHIRNAEGTHTAADIKKQYKAQKGKCYYCNVKVDDEYHVDHIVPLSRGGSNDPSNLVISCPTCNLSKNDRLPHEWPQGGRLL